MRAKYHQIVARIAADIHEGRLKPGDRLPTHRQLAFEHGLSLGTATRVFAELDAMGLTTGEVGRGSFVRRQSDARAGGFRLHDNEPGTVDLSLNHFLLPEQEEIFRISLAAVAASGTDVLGYRETIGSRREREVIADWLACEGQIPRSDPDLLTICAGGQHGLFLSLLSACRPGDVVAVETLTYPVIRQACARLHLNVVEVASDEEGIAPEALDALCREMPIHMLFTMPNLQNPTSITMPEPRRRALAEVIRRHGIFVIEDDAYGFLLDAPPISLKALLPDLVFYLRNLSKSWAPGLRIGYLLAPQEMRKAVEQVQGSTIWTATPLMSSLACQLIASGAYDEVIISKRKEITKRQKLVSVELKEHQLQTAPRSMHVLLRLPTRRRSSTLPCSRRGRRATEPIWRSRRRQRRTRRAAIVLGGSPRQGPAKTRPVGNCTTTPSTKLKTALTRSFEKP